MLLTTVNGVIYRVHFHHFQDNQKHWNTQVTIHTGQCSFDSTGKVCKKLDSVTGKSRCNPTDTFTKAEGRAVALDRALKFGYPRALRIELWAAYKNLGAQLPKPHRRIK